MNASKEIMNSSLLFGPRLTLVDGEDLFLRPWTETRLSERREQVQAMEGEATAHTALLIMFAEGRSLYLHSACAAIAPLGMELSAQVSTSIGALRCCHASVSLCFTVLHTVRLHYTVLVNNKATLNPSHNTAPQGRSWVQACEAIEFCHVSVGLPAWFACKRLQDQVVTGLRSFPAATPMQSDRVE
jgi:hypothetical protein